MEPQRTLPRPAPGTPTSASESCGRGSRSVAKRCGRAHSSWLQPPNRGCDSDSSSSQGQTREWKSLWLQHPWTPWRRIREDTPLPRLKPHRAGPPGHESRCGQNTAPRMKQVSGTSAGIGPREEVPAASGCTGAPRLAPQETWMFTPSFPGPSWTPESRSRRLRCGNLSLGGETATFCVTDREVNTQESGHRSDRRNALGSKGRTALSHTGLPERRGESSLPSPPGTLWGVRPASVPEPLPGGAWAHLDTPARGSVSPHGASRALKGRLPWWRWGGTRPGSR